MIITLDEEANLVRSLASLHCLRDILIVDSGSSDATLELSKSAHPDVKIVTRDFDSFAQQCNFGLSHVSTEWVLSIDGDYILTPELVDEIESLNPPDDVVGYSAEFNYCVHGYRLRNTVYPPRTILYRRRLAEYRDEGHGHRVQIGGRVLKLMGKVDHDDRKPLSHWIRSQDRYAKIEAQHLLARPASQLSRQDRLRKKIYFAPAAMFLYLLIGRGLILDGWPGWYYVMQRTIAEMLLSLRLLTERQRLEQSDGRERQLDCGRRGQITEQGLRAVGN